MPTHVIVYYKYCGFKFAGSTQSDFEFECVDIDLFNPDAYGLIYWRFV